MGWIEAGESLDRIAKAYGMKDSREAYRRAIKENPNLSAEYNDSRNVGAPMNYDISSSDRVMQELQVDRAKVQRLAGAVLHTGAVGIAGGFRRYDGRGNEYHVYIR